MNKDIFHKFPKEEDAKQWCAIYREIGKLGSFTIQVMRDKIKLPRDEFGKCLLFQGNLIEFVTLMTTNMN